MAVMNIFAPPLDTMWRLTTDWKPGSDFMRRYDNDEFVLNFNCSTKLTDWPGYANVAGRTWTDDRRAEYQAWCAQQWADNPVVLPVVLPAGTVVVFDRYHISHSGDHAITLRVLISPDPRITPKKLGGRGRGKLRFYLLVGELNTFPPVEPVESLT